MAPLKIVRNDPLYIGPLDVIWVVFISIKLTGTESYGTWIKLMRIALHGKKKHSFVVGALTKGLYKDKFHEQ